MDRSLTVVLFSNNVDEVTIATWFVVCVFSILIVGCGGCVLWCGGLMCSIASDEGWEKEKKTKLTSPTRVNHGDRFPSSVLWEIPTCKWFFVYCNSLNWWIWLWRENFFAQIRLIFASKSSEFLVYPFTSLPREVRKYIDVSSLKFRLHLYMNKMMLLSSLYYRYNKTLIFTNASEAVVVQTHHQRRYHGFVILHVRSGDTSRA